MELLQKICRLQKDELFAGLTDEIRAVLAEMCGISTEAQKN